HEYVSFVFLNKNLKNPLGSIQFDERTWCRGPTRVFALSTFCRELRETNGATTAISEGKKYRCLRYRQQHTRLRQVRRGSQKKKKAQKKELDKVRDETRVNIGVAFQRWREFLDLEGLKTDAELATFLLDRKNSTS
ncbi:hypothetical protein GJAV_G00199450, partial [Gymnothorax javanicus]